MSPWALLQSSNPAIDLLNQIMWKERREFMVDPFVLDKYPFRVLMEMVRKKDVIFVDVDSILFEHMLWLVCSDQSKSAFSMVQLNLRDIIEFYSSDN
jgi:hypothetical protein